MRLDIISKYKSEIMETLCSNKDIVSLIPGFETSTVPNNTLMYTKIFPFYNIDKCVTEAGQYICFDVDVRDLKNSKMQELSIYFWFICSTENNIIRTDKGIRNDVLASYVYNALLANINLGIGHISLIENNAFTKFVPLNGWSGRQLILSSKEYNNTKEAVNLCL